MSIGKRDDPGAVNSAAGSTLRLSTGPIQLQDVFHCSARPDDR